MALLAGASASTAGDGTGYTGEDGFEISLPLERADAIVARSCSANDRRGANRAWRTRHPPAGSRVYASTAPTSTKRRRRSTASLAWAIQAARRRNGEREGGSFCRHRNHSRSSSLIGTSRCRVGFLHPEGRAPIRAGAENFRGGRRIGEARRHCHFGRVRSEPLGRPVAMGYVPAAFATPRHCRFRRSTQQTVADDCHHVFAFHNGEIQTRLMPHFLMRAR